MNDIIIPPEVVEAAARAYEVARGKKNFDMEDCIFAAIIAALKAWPGSSYLCDNDSATIRDLECLILPLTQETDA